MIYDILSPDNFEINRGQTYETVYKAYRAFITWKNQYTKQGYYSSVKYGKIHLDDVKHYCQITEHDTVAFNEWFKSDNVIKDENGKYRTQCSLYRIPMNLGELNAYFMKEYSSNH